MTTTTNTPMTLADAMSLLRRPTATAEIGKCADTFVVALWPHGTGHGGTALTVSLDREMTSELRDRLSALMERNTEDTK